MNIQNITWKKRCAIATGHAFEFYDVVVYASISAYIGLHFFPENNFGQHSMLYVWFAYALRFVSRPVGGFLVGAYADKYGRRSALIFTSALTGFATLGMALLPGYEHIGLFAPLLLCCMQLMQSFSFGGELPTVSVYLLENAQKKEHGRIGFLLMGMTFGVMFLSLLVVFCVERTLSTADMQAYGWRIPLLLGMVNIGISYYFKTRLIELSTFKKSGRVGLQKRASFKIFLLNIPTCMLFYGNALSSSVTVKAITDNPTLQVILPMLFNLTYFIFGGIVGCLIDRYTRCETALKLNYALLLVLGVPVYMLQAEGSFIAVMVSQIFITMFTSVALCATMPYEFEQTQPKNRITTMAVGHNMSVVIFGSVTPLLVTTLLSYYSATYVGIVYCLSGLSFFGVLALNRQEQRLNREYISQPVSS